MTQALQTANQALDLANSSPSRASEIARGVLDRSGEPDVVAVAARAAALAAANLLDAPSASSYADLSLDAAERAGDRELLGLCHMTAGGIASWTGDLEAAQEHLGAAARLVSSADQPRVLVQRASVAYRAGSWSDALADLDAAEPILRESGDHTWLAHLHVNRGIVRGYTGQVGAAEEDFLTARALYIELGLLSSAAELLQNLGWLDVQRGRYSDALRWFDEAERDFARLQYPMGELLRDRSDALIACHLADEALVAAQRAAMALERAGMAAGHAEALLRVARAALLCGRLQLAAQEAGAAEHMFVVQGRPVFAGMATTLRIRAEVAAGALREEHRAELEESMVALDSERAGVALQRARVLSARLAIQDGRGPAATELLARVGRQPVRPLDVEVELALARGLLARAEGDRRRAFAALRTGLRTLEDAQVAVGATDLRAHLALHGRDLRSLAGVLALEAGRPRQLLAWLERCASTQLRLPPPADDHPPEVQSLLGRYRALSALGSGISEAEESAAELADLERQIASLTRARRGGGLAARVTAGIVEEIGDELDGATFCHFAIIDARVHAVRMANGRSSHLVLGPIEEVRSELDALRAGMQVRAAAWGRGSSPMAGDLLVDGASSALRRLLGRPLRGASSAVVACPPELLSVPWHQVTENTSVPVSVVPSGSAWLVTRRAPGRGDAPRTSLYVAGPRLLHADSEVVHLGTADPGSSIVLPSVDATADSVKAAFPHHDVVHFATHGRFLAGNPLFSALEMADGPLLIHDLEAGGPVPGVVVLSACDVGRSAALGDSEAMGMVIAFLSLGSRAVLASVSPVPDTGDVARVMEQVHAGLRAGRSGAEALALARSVDDAGVLDSFNAYGGG
jgi:tetratricopeptide (TPR) repeat protein